MALCELLKSTIHDSRDDPERESVRRAKQQIPMLLFKDEHREQVDSLVEVTAAAQMDGGILQLPSSCFRTEYNELFVVISPGTSKRTTPVPPNAPIKPRRLFSKVGLKPKKLHFVEQRERNGKAALDANHNDERADRLIRSNGHGTGGPGPSGDASRASIHGNESKEQLKQKNLNVMLQNLQLDASTSSNKENRRYGKEQCDRKMKKERARSTKAAASSSSARSSRPNSSLQDVKKCPLTLSRCDNNLPWQEKLLWLQPRRDVGMMIQCCRRNCKKWRYCDDYHDPVDVPQIWYCEMNSDKFIASCYTPEVPTSNKFQNDLIENKYNAGSIVWVRVNRYPWWPAMVDDCPEALQYYELQGTSTIPVKYHVTFLNNQHLGHTWLNNYRIKPFIKYKKSDLAKKTIYYGVDYKEQLEIAYALAQTAISLSILHRLRAFSYVSQLRKMQGSQDKGDICDIVSPKRIEVDDQDDEIIPTTPNNHITLKQFYYNSFVKGSMEEDSNIF